MRGPLPPYDLAAIGLRAYTALALDVRVLGAQHLRLRPRMLIVCTHRSDRDVPVIGGHLWFAHGSWRRRALLPHFAVRDDMFLRGFFAGYPPWPTELPRRLLWPFGIGPAMARLRCRPVRSAGRIRVVEVLRALPDVPVGELLPAEAVGALRVDARTPAREALRGRAAEALWRVQSRAELDSPLLEEVWAERRRAAHADFRALLETVAGGGTLLIFPEGRPSPDGRIGPLERGVGALVRRARPDVVLPIALAYDPLVRSRTRVHVSVGRPTRPPERDADAELLALLRRTMPLTAGQIVARDADPDEEVAAALEERRPVEPELLDPSTRARRIAEARAAPRDEDALLRLAREHASARGEER